MNEEFLRKFHYYGGIIGIVSSICVVFIFWFFKEIRLFQYELIMFLGLSRIIIDVSIIWPNENDKVCKIKGFISTIFSKFSWCFVTYLSYISFIFGVKKKFIDNNKNLLRFFLFFISLITSGTFGFILFKLNAIGKVNEQCHINNYDGKKVSFYFDLFFIIINFYLLVKIYILISKLKKIGKGKELRKMNCIIQLFPIFKSITSIISILETIDTSKIFNENYYRIIIYFFSGFFTTMLFILYIFLPHVRVSLEEFFVKICCGKTDIENFSEENLNDMIEESNEI